MSNMQKAQTANKNSGDITSELFRLNWGMFRKILRGDYMSHKAAYGKLRDVLNEEMNRPFTFADLACGDAYATSRYLNDTRIAAYIGIDLSEAALEYAREETERLRCEKSFIVADFVDFDRFMDTTPDVVWVGLSLHHLETEDKARFMVKVRETLNKDGIFLIYEPVFIDDEDRKSYFDRFKRVSDVVWKDLTPEERSMLLDHVRDTELPETIEGWLSLGREAGFSEASALYSDPTGLYTLFRYK